MYCASYFSGEKSHWWCNISTSSHASNMTQLVLKGQRAGRHYFTNPVIPAVKLVESWWCLFAPCRLHYIYYQSRRTASSVPQRTLGTNRTMIHQHQIQICSWQRKESRWCNTPKSRPPPDWNAAAGPQESCALITTHEAPWNEGILLHVTSATDCATSCWISGFSQFFGSI